MSKRIFHGFLLLLAAIVSLSSLVAIPVLLDNEIVPHEANASDVSMRMNNMTGAFFRRHPSVAHLDCSKVIAHDEKYIQQMAKQRVSYEDDPSLPMDCQSIRQRHFFADEPASKEEAAFPIAFSRAVYKDYLLVEMELAASYAPQNWYCYAVDSKSDSLFKAKMYSLAECFENVVVNAKEFLMDSAGHNMSFAQVECMKTLAVPDKNWEYLISLQNHDIAVRTNEELVEILKRFDGANDLEIVKTPPNRINWNMDWTFEGLNLFRNTARNKEIDSEGYRPRLTFAKGYVTSSLSRAAVDYMINELNLDTMLTQLDTLPYGIDEIYLQTLMTTDALKIPGGFTHACLDKGIGVPHVTRFAAWYGTNCESGQFRHDVCIFGLEDIAVSFRDSNHFYGNKMMPAFDFGAISCWHEELFNRSNLDRGLHRIKPDLYENLPQVRFHAERKKNGFVDKNNFDCSLGSINNFA